MIDESRLRRMDKRISDLKAALQKGDTEPSIPMSYLDTDGTLAANSDEKVPTQKAVKSYADTKLTIPGAWSDWTPTLTGITKGAGGTIVARYEQIGKTVRFFFLFTFGAGSAITGPVAFTLPVASKYDDVPVNSLITDNDVGRFIASSFVASNACYVRVLAPGQNYQTPLDSTVPMTWANGDRISVSGEYEIA
jgi:hypothetical protein